MYNHNKVKKTSNTSHTGCPYRKTCNKIEALCPYLYQRPNRSYVK